MNLATVAREQHNVSFGLASRVSIAVAVAALLGTVGCNEKPASAQVTPTTKGAPLTAGPHAEGDHFAVDAALVGTCAPATECAVGIKLVVKDEFHVNKEFPHKFTAQDAAGVEFLGKDPAKKNVFSKASGDFVASDEKNAVLTVRFKAQAGAPTIQGTLKIGICNEQTCLMPQVDLAIPVTVK
jgi:hypothetical protein